MENIEELDVLNNRKWAVAVGNPECDLHPMASLCVLGSRSIDSKCISLAGTNGSAVCDMVFEIASALIMPSPRNHD